MKLLREVITHSAFAVSLFVRKKNKLPITKSFWILIFVIVDVQITAIVFFYFQVGWGRGGVVWDWLLDYLITNQRLSRACIIHLVIKRTNWSYVKTMSCSGSHLGITINIKNTKFVKDLPMINAQFRFNQCNSFREEYISVFPHMVLC
jgi:hypothetical protein